MAHPTKKKDLIANKILDCGAWVSQSSRDPKKAWLLFAQYITEAFCTDGEVLPPSCGIGHRGLYLLLGISCNVLHRCGAEALRNLRSAQRPTGGALVYLSLLNSSRISSHTTIMAQSKGACCCGCVGKQWILSSHCFRQFMADTVHQQRIHRSRGTGIP